MISWTNLLTKPYCKPLPDACLPARQGQAGALKSVVVWNVTSRCNLSCQHCYFDAIGIQDPHELRREEAENFIEDLSKIKIPVLLFSGGEPLLREDIFHLAAFAKERGIKPALSTNGTLITKEIAKKIKVAGFFYVGISLDGMQKINDWFRKKPGAFNYSLSAIKNCKEMGLKVGLRFTLTQYNLKDLPDIFDLVEKEGIKRFCIYHLVYSGRADNLKENDLTHKQRRKALEIIWQRTLNFYQKGLDTEVLTVDNHADGVWIYLRLKKINPKRAKMVLDFLKRQGGNSSGIRIVAVDNCGNVYPDQFWRSHILGDIRQRNFSNIWQDKDNHFLVSLRNRKTLLKGRCQRCNYMSICNGNFRARAEAVFADPWAEDPGCYLTEEEISS